MKEHKIDVKGLQCPQPIVETARAVNKAQSGDLIVVESTDEGFSSDIKAWCDKTGNELVKNEKRLSFWHVVIKKK